MLYTLFFCNVETWQQTRLGCKRWQQVAKLQKCSVLSVPAMHIRESMGVKSNDIAAGRYIIQTFAAEVPDWYSHHSVVGKVVINLIKQLQLPMLVVYSQRFLHPQITNSHHCDMISSNTSTDFYTCQKTIPVLKKQRSVPPFI